MMRKNRLCCSIEAIVKSTHFFPTHYVIIMLLTTSDIHIAIILYINFGTNLYITSQ